MKTKEAKNTDNADSNFIDCGEPIKTEIRIEETLDEDPLSIHVEAEEDIVNTEAMVNYEDIDFPVFGQVQIEQVKLETNEENQVDKDNNKDGDNVNNQDLNAMNGGEGNDNNVVENIEDNVEQVEQANNVVLENLTHEEALAFFS